MAQESCRGNDHEQVSPAGAMLTQRLRPRRTYDIERDGAPARLLPTCPLCRMPNPRNLQAEYQAVLRQIQELREEINA